MVDQKDIPSTHAENLVQRDRLLDEREKLIIAKSQGQEAVKNLRE